MEAIRLLTPRHPDAPLSALVDFENMRDAVDAYRSENKQLNGAEIKIDYNTKPWKSAK